MRQIEGCSAGLKYPKQRIDCHTEADATEEKCLRKLCCSDKNTYGHAWCFKPSGGK